MQVIIPKYWTCPSCKKTHVVVKDQPVMCSGPGHDTYISYAYWTYRVQGKEEKETPKPNTQTQLF